MSDRLCHWWFLLRKRWATSDGEEEALATRIYGARPLVEAFLSAVVFVAFVNLVIYLIAWLIRYGG